LAAVFSNSSCIYHVLQKLNIADDYDEKRALHFNPSEKQYPSPLDDILSPYIEEGQTTETKG
jgi:hypothetical protein